MNSTDIRLGIISALSEEQAGLIEQMQHAQSITRGRRDFITGTLWGVSSICVVSRIGKVAAAATATTLIERFNVTHIVFTGVAGGADGDVRVGDIVVANGLLQHDMDASPLFPRFEVPLTGLSWFAADLALTAQLKHAAQQFLLQDFMQEINDADRAEFKLKTPRIHYGLIASGDEFINCDIKLSSLKQHLPALLAVEMEGAAVAQVCHEFGVPFAVVRTISDDANRDAAINFTRFVEHVARCYARNIIRRFCAAMA